MPRQRSPNVQGPYGFEMSENCQSCNLRKHHFFCNLDGAALSDFNAIKSLSAYPRDAVLFREQEYARGIFVLCAGEIKLSMVSREGKTLILRIAKAGEVLGLSAVIGGMPYEVTAETLRPSQVAYVGRDDFLKFIKLHPEACHNVSKHVVSSYNGLCEQFRTVVLASTSEKLAKVLLEWSDGSEQAKPFSRIMIPLTHEEIGELIGATRETVTRTLGDFKSRHLIGMNGAAVTIKDRKALEEIAEAC